MSEDLQALFMEARIVRLACARWNLPMRQVVRLFSRHGVLEYVGNCFDYFHMEGDEAVLDDVTEYLAARGVDVHAAA